MSSSRDEGCAAGGGLVPSLPAILCELRDRHLVFLRCRVGVDLYFSASVELLSFCVDSSNSGE